LLTTLATPRVAEGPAIDVQTDLVDALEKLIEKKIEEREWGVSHSELNLGGILVDRLPDAGSAYRTTKADKRGREAEVQDIFDRLVDGGAEESEAPAVEFVGLTTDVRAARSAGVAFGGDVKEAGLGPKVVENALKTMIDADQFEYLRLAGLPNDRWKILVELHYIRARPKDMAGFHKDTQGQSLFVNLNYHVPGRQVRGPEYVLNPPGAEEHDKRIYGTAETEGTLPDEFTEDLAATREALGEPARIESSPTVEPLGYVAFVDEAVHHATPWFGNRYVTPSEFNEYLERNHKAQLDEIITADTAYRARPARRRLASFSGYVNKSIIPKREVTKWRKWLAMISVSESERSKRHRETKYTRQDFAATMPGGEFDLMLEEVGSQPEAERLQGGAGGWYAASIAADLPGRPPLRSPVKSKDKPPLVRTASNAKLTKNWPAQLPEEVPRRFIRSWVRAVPARLADDLRGS
jgi:hypothetical protein